MAGRSNRSRFAYLKFDDIQKAIDENQLDAYDIIYTYDTHENFIITPDLQPISVGSRIYRFEDIETAESALNVASDTYEGQIIAITNEGHYSAYIVNRNESGTFYVSSLTSDIELDYDALTHRPISNLTGTLSQPIVLEDLSTGIYQVKGQYKISEALETLFSSSACVLFLVEHEESCTLVRRIDTREITDYKIEGGQLSSSTIPTTQWLKEQGYATETYVDNKIAALDFINKSDVESYVSRIVTETVNNIVDQKIDTAFQERIQIASVKEALESFATVFN